MMLRPLKIGILALQGAVFEHEQQLKNLGAVPILVKTKRDFYDEKGITTLDALIIPGGESTAIGKLIREYDLAETIIQFSKSGHWIFGTCAGLILCSHADEYSQLNNELRLNLIDIQVERNGFGRQKDSFETDLLIKNIDENIPAIFIRAPFIKTVGPNVTILATFADKIVAAQSGRVMVTAFHPELTQDTRILKYFVDQI